MPRGRRRTPGRRGSRERLGRDPRASSRRSRADGSGWAPPTRAGGRARRGAARAFAERPTGCRSCRSLPVACPDGRGCETNGADHPFMRRMIAVPIDGAAADAPAGEGEPFDAFFEAHYVRLARALYLLTGNAAEAEDLAQDAMLRVYERWERVSTMGS